jgi:peptidoglycan lytic transglycosylase G
MSAHRTRRSHRLVPLWVWWLLGGLIVLISAGVLLTHHIYDRDLSAVNTDPTTKIFTINRGSSVEQIANNLQRSHLIRSAWAFQLYVRGHGLNDQLQAGTYALSASQDTPSIVNTLTKGKVATKLVTILPGRRIDQVRADLINDGFSPTSVDQALNPAQYASLPVMAFKPASVITLEGLLWPDSFQKSSATSPSTIIRESLVEMGRQLTPDVQATFANEGLNTYQGLILASIVEQEVSKPTDQSQAAQVFMSRLKAGTTLGSDVTARYGAIEAGLSPSLSYDSPYNTLIHTGLPPTPISTVSPNSLAAAEHPAATNWLYFVTGDNGTTYFSTNLQDHEAQVQQYCHKLCSN